MIYFIEMRLYVPSLCLLIPTERSASAKQT